MSGYKKKGPAKKSAKPRTRPYLHNLREVDPYERLIEEREALASPATPPPSPEDFPPASAPPLPPPPRPRVDVSAVEGTPLSPEDLVALVDGALAYETATSAAHIAYAAGADAVLLEYVAQQAGTGRDRAKRHLAQQGAARRAEGGALGFPMRQASLLDRALIRLRIKPATG